MKKIILLGMSIFVLYGCAVANGPWGSATINKVSLGMNKAQVIEVMGSPTSTSATEGVEYLNYTLIEAFGVNAPYFVRLKNGKVDAYGKRGDFDSTKVPENKTTIDLNINK